ncbi:alpha/beta hydrolase fold domain-containing protein [Gordonia sp. SID5947]|nr:alpha/beta hydrolase fold domain-containing protein [Gordonia sp. SID5947]
MQDCILAYRWALRRGHEPHTIAVAGDSAGGFLAMSVALACREMGLPMPGAVVGISPWLELDVTDKLAHQNSNTERLLPVTAFATICRLGGVHDAPVPTVADLSHDELRALPPTLLTACDDEFLRLDSEQLADRLSTTGVEHELHLWQDMIHAFPAVIPSSPEGRQAIGSVADFISKNTAAKRFSNPHRSSRRHSA